MSNLNWKDQNGFTTLNTRNRYGQSITNDSDEFIDNKPTGRIVSKVEITEDGLVYHYNDGKWRVVNNGKTTNINAPKDYIAIPYK